MSDRFTLVLLVGISGSGKSTYASKLSKEINAKIISSDNCREELTGSKSNMSNDGYMWTKVLPERLEKELQGNNVIFDSTACYKKPRKWIINMAKSMSAKIECHYFEPDVKRALIQNRLRLERQVPEEVIHRQAANWQTPETDEGIDLILNLDQKSCMDSLTKELHVLGLYDTCQPSAS